MSDNADDPYQQFCRCSVTSRSAASVDLGCPIQGRLDSKSLVIFSHETLLSDADFWGQYSSTHWKAARSGALWQGGAQRVGLRPVNQDQCQDGRPGDSGGCGLTGPEPRLTHSAILAICSLPRRRLKVPHDQLSLIAAQYPGHQWLSTLSRPQCKGASFLAHVDVQADIRFISSNTFGVVLTMRSSDFSFTTRLYAGPLRVDLGCRPVRQGPRCS